MQNADMFRYLYGLWATVSLLVGQLGFKDSQAMASGIHGILGGMGKINSLASCLCKHSIGPN